MHACVLPAGVRCLHACRGQAGPPARFPLALQDELARAKRERLWALDDAQQRHFLAEKIKLGRLARLEQTRVARGPVSCLPAAGRPGAQRNQAASGPGPPARPPLPWAPWAR